MIIRVAQAIFPQKLIPGFLELLLHLRDFRRIHHHSPLPFHLAHRPLVLCDDGLHYDAFG
jgi:hypothetical protein